MSSISVAILTVSDTCSNGQAVDKSGPNLEHLVENGSLIPSAKVIDRACVPDDVSQIRKKLDAWCNMGINVVLTTGGTGFSPRDVTPEATREILHKETPGITMAMMKYSLEVAFPHAMLSRAISGIRDRTLIINLPGSLKGAAECLSAVSPCIPHAVALLCDNSNDVGTVHKLIQASEPQIKTAVSKSDLTFKNHHHHHHHEHGHCNHGDKHLESKVDVHKVAERSRHSPYPMMEVPVAQSKVLAAAAILGTEAMYFRDAIGRILAEDVFANDPLPPFPASIKDGYAVIAADGSGKRKVLGSSAAGQVPGGVSLQSGQCVRITTGAAVPVGADSVVQVEDTHLVHASADNTEELEINIMKIPKVGEDIRPLGSDIQAGQLVLASGSTLGPAELGLLATVGVTSIQVYRCPKVAVLSTGNELQDPKEGEPLKAGHIRDSNKTTLLALLQEHGFSAIDMGIAPDEPQALLDALQKSLSCADVVVTTGGVSMGERDLLKSILTTDLNATLHFGRINMKPGKPTTFATCNFMDEKRLVFGLPGNPVSATVTCQLFVLPALRKMCGYSNPMPPTIKATITEDLHLDTRPEYHRAVLSWTPGEAIPSVKSTGNQLSSRLLSCYSSNCFIVLPASEKCFKLPSGSMVDAVLLKML